MGNNDWSTCGNIDWAYLQASRHVVITTLIIIIIMTVIIQLLVITITVIVILITLIQTITIVRPYARRVQTTYVSTIQ